MKKILSLVVCMLICLSVQADEHLKFMGIPLDGTITQFQAKLAKKGVAHDVAGSKVLPPGSRLFKGVFSGKEAYIHIYYDTASKLVYRAKVVITTSDDQDFENNYNYFVRMLSEKYLDAKKDIGETNNHEDVSFLVYNIETAQYMYKGIINVYRVKLSNYYNSYSLHIDYEDTINSVKRDDRNMEDL